MADKDEVDDIYGDDNAPHEDDDLSAKLREAIESAQDADTDEDDEGIAAPLDEPEESSTVSQEEGLSRVDKARTGKAGAKPEADKSQDDAETAKAAKDDAAAEDPEKADTKPEETTDWSKAEPGKLLEGLDDTRRQEVSRRLDEASAITGLFKGHEDELKQHGATPASAVQRFLDLNRLAQTNPDEYVAWVATQTGGDKPAEVLGKAAERLGFKLVPNQQDDDDDFLTPEVKAIKEENARLKAERAGQQPDFGPDTPERKQAREAQQKLTEFVSARDPQTGQPLRPHFESLRPMISDMAASHIKQTGKPVTVEDLDRFYRDAEARVQQIAGVQPTSAAQEQQRMSDDMQKKAASAQRAKQASKSIDGTGQGATRRPALPANASIDDVLRAQLASQMGE